MKCEPLHNNTGRIDFETIETICRNLNVALDELLIFEPSLSRGGTRAPNR